jgi:hypothetical protein
MGLDMYLTAKRYISGYFDPKDKERADIIKSVFPELSDNEHLENDLVKEVTVRVGYWRKANAIHKWFVDNVQDGVDECQDSYVSREDLLKLKSACEAVHSNCTKAPEILPTQAGFFFGDTSYDEFYFQDIEQTIKIIDAALKLPESWDFEYYASW